MNLTKSIGLIALALLVGIVAVKRSNDAGKRDGERIGCTRIVQKIFNPVVYPSCVYENGTLVIELKAVPMRGRVLLDIETGQEI